MKVASFRHRGEASWGIVEGDVLFDVGAVLRREFPDVKSLLAAGSWAAARAAVSSAPRMPLADIQWLPVIPNPDKILCVGLNYETHRRETGRAEVGHPTIFARFANSQTGHLAPLLRPRVSTEFDYEGELALVIGRSCRYVPREEAFAVIAGFACYNDGSVRDGSAIPISSHPERTSRTPARSGHGLLHRRMWGRWRGCGCEHE
jgi:2-keto-4-pentenoate hydratase/2-oxohepta-3-ene-1,7-dioic acid hydratase in catechol pathway